MNLATVSLAMVSPVGSKRYPSKSNWGEDDHASVRNPRRLWLRCMSPNRPSVWSLPAHSAASRCPLPRQLLR
jgi:hypothetical protein